MTNMTDTQNCPGPVADLWRCLHTQRTYPWLVSDQEDGRRELEGKLRQAVDNCWTNTNIRLLSEAIRRSLHMFTMFDLNGPQAAFRW